MNTIESKQAIEIALKTFGSQRLDTSAIGLFGSLGYRSDKRLSLKPNIPETFLDTFAKERPFNREQAMLNHWQSVDLLFQLTDDEVRTAAIGHQFQFDSKGKFDGAAMESYLFFAITLKESRYTRAELSSITRAVNRLFPMPVMLLFRHGQTLTVAVINRRLHKRDESKDVLEKVTLIKDIRFANPHRAHIEILSDLSFNALLEKHSSTNFVTLHAAWQKALDSSELNKRFFQEVANWYFWALNHTKFPKDAPKQDGKDHISVIRLITRLMFCWFIKEKGLVPDTLFDERKLEQILRGFAPENISDKTSVFYKAILQNLFFATLNTEMDKRGWTKEEQNFMAHSLYRYRDLFVDSAAALDLFKNIPFLNGGLFECLDKDLGEKASPRYQRIDGFSRRTDSQVVAPDFLFFGPEREVDLSADYGDAKFKRVKVRGLIHTLDHYKFTITENTPIEEEIALDPELSGKVFENLLAAYNPETGATARKQTGSFYTPREIVDYMVNEALIACLKTKLETTLPSAKDVETRLRHLFTYNDKPNQFMPQEVDALITAIDSLKSLDPAVGSGAFPMGILHKLVFILGKLDPRNEKWKERQISRVREAMVAAEQIEDASIRDRALRDLEQQIVGIKEAFEHNELDYGRKLYLIENCIYGVDIQPIAVQIAKMRFFISLIVDQKIDDAQTNRGVRPLPNLETKFVAANTLIGISRPGQQMLRNREIDTKETELRRVRERHFTARTPATKDKCREQDAKLRAAIAELLKGDGWEKDTATKLSLWNPYDQNASAAFFDPEWMFGIKVEQTILSASARDGQRRLSTSHSGFDIVIANPPYIRQEVIRELKPLLKSQGYECFDGTADLFVYFYEKSVKLLRTGGVLSFISPNKYYRAGYGEKLRAFLACELTLHQLLDFGDAPVFEAIAYASILIGSKRVPETRATARAYTWQPDIPLADFAEVLCTRGVQISQTELKSDGWRLESSIVLQFLEKLRKAGKPLGEYVRKQIFFGIKTGLNEAFIVDRATRDRLITEHKSSLEILKPFLRGRDVKRWREEYANLYLIRIESSENKEHPWSGKTEKEAEKIFANTYPAIHARFHEFRNQLIGRDDQGKYFWELRSCAYWGKFEEQKILYPDIYEHQSFTWDERDFFATNTCILFLQKRNG